MQHKSSIIYINCATEINTLNITANGDDKYHFLPSSMALSLSLRMWVSNDLQRSAAFMISPPA